MPNIFKHISKIDINLSAIITWLKNAFTSYGYFRIIALVIHSFTIVWASINSFVYTGCLESQLLCPQVFFHVPFSAWYWNIRTELPLLLLAIILSAVNITIMTATTQFKKANYTLTAIAFTIICISTLFIRTSVAYEAALTQELQKLQQEGKLKDLKLQ